MNRLERVPARLWWLAVFLVALALRLPFLAYWQKGGFNQTYGYDAYPLIAQHWLGWLPNVLDVAYPPVYPLWITLIFLCLGKPVLLAVQAFNILFSCLSCVLVGIWAERAISRPVGRLSGLWAACDPLLLFFSVQLQSEAFFVFLELIFFLALQRMDDDSDRAAVLGLGLFGGALALTRSVFVLYPALLCAVLLAFSKRRARAWKWLLLIPGWILPISLWAARNAVKYHEFIPLSINGGWNMWEGFTLDREEVRRRPYDMGLEAQRAGIDVTAHPTAASAYFSRKLKGFVRAHPAQAAKIVAGKLLLYWRPWPYDPHQRSVRVVLSVYFTALFLLALIGLWSLRGRWRSLAPVLALFAYLSLMHSVFFTSLRYRSPLEPFLCCFAAVGALALARRSS